VVRPARPVRSPRLPLEHELELELEHEHEHEHELELELEPHLLEM
jgi:hypothetical protein